MGGKMVLHAETVVSLSRWMPHCDGNDATFAADNWLLASHTQSTVHPTLIPYF